MAKSNGSGKGSTKLVTAEQHDAARRAQKAKRRQAIGGKGVRLGSPSDAIDRACRLKAEVESVISAAKSELATAAIAQRRFREILAETRPDLLTAVPVIRKFQLLAKFGNGQIFRYLPKPDRTDAAVLDLHKIFALEADVASAAYNLWRAAQLADQHYRLLESLRFLDRSSRRSGGHFDAATLAACLDNVAQVETALVNLRVRITEHEQAVA